jgi:hypothetical protein
MLLMLLVAQQTVTRKQARCAWLRQVTLIIVIGRATAGQLLPVPVRVGQAVDVVAQAGRPKSITGKRMCIDMHLNIPRQLHIAAARLHREIHS